MAQRTPFYDRHVALGGKIVDFAGWELPVQYSTITLEHNAVRNQAGLFDISHMGQVLVWGPDALPYLQKILTNNIQKSLNNKGVYAHLLNDKGGVIDDLFVYGLEEDRFLVIVNASRREMDYAWMVGHKGSFQVELLEAPYSAGFALQGPQAAAIVGKLNPNISRMARFEIQEFEIGDVSSHVARTGYTGEDGFEFFGPAGHLLIIWDHLLSVGKDMGLLPCGLGARDTLRTEVAYPLYGHELDENHTPLEAGLGWVISWDKGDFIGRKALEKQKAAGPKNHLVGFKVSEGGVARNGGEISYNGASAGTVASGTFSPTLGVPIGMALLPVSVPREGAELIIRQGTRELRAHTVKLPFFKKSLKPVPSS